MTAHVLSTAVLLLVAQPGAEPSARAWLAVCPAAPGPRAAFMQASPRAAADGTTSWSVQVSAVDASGNTASSGDTAVAPPGFVGVPATRAASIQELDGGVFRAWSPLVSVTGVARPRGESAPAEITLSGVRCDGLLLELEDAASRALLLVEPSGTGVLSVGAQGMTVLSRVEAAPWLPARRGRPPKQRSVLPPVFMELAPTLADASVGGFTAWRLDTRPPAWAGRMVATRSIAGAGGRRLSLVHAVTGDGGVITTWAGAHVDGWR